MIEEKDFQENFPFHEPDDDTEIIHIAAHEHSRPWKFGRILIIFIIAIAVVFAAKALYDLGKGKLNGGEIPTIEADPEPYKSVPENPGGMQIPNIDKEIYSKLKMPIDTPIAEPQPSQKNDALSKAIEKEQKRIASEDIQNNDSTKVIRPPETHKQGPETIKLTPSGPRIIDIPQQSEPSPKVKKIDIEKVLAGKGEINEIWLQLGSFKSEDEATKAWQDMREKNADIIKDLTVKVKKSDMKEQGVFYRLEVGPVGDEKNAQSMCARFNERKQNCFYTSFKVQEND